jgi:hypothetical protein
VKGKRDYLGSTERLAWLSWNVVGVGGLPLVPKVPAMGILRAGIWPVISQLAVINYILWLMSALCIPRVNKPSKEIKRPMQLEAELTSTTRFTTDRHLLISE